MKKNILLTLIFLNTLFPSIVSAKENVGTETKYEWYLPQEADKQLPWNSHDPWNEWGSSISLGITLNPSMNFDKVDDGFMSGLTLGFNGISLGYQSNETFQSYRLEVLANKTFLADRLSVDLYNPDLRVSLMSPVLFTQLALTTVDISELAVGMIAGIDLINVRAVYEDFVFVQLTLGSYVYGFEQIKTPSEPEDLKKFSESKFADMSRWQDSYEKEEEDGYYNDNNGIGDTYSRSISGFQGSFRLIVGISF